MEQGLIELPPFVKRLCRDPFFVIASDRRERGNLWVINAL